MSKPPSREPRRQTFVKAHLLNGSEWIEVTLGNVSETGLLVKLQGGREVGTQVELRRRGTTILGEVVWSTEKRFGVRSFEEIDVPALLEPGLPTKQADMSPPEPYHPWFWRETRDPAK
jgi:hypothetical protein